MACARVCLKFLCTLSILIIESIGHDNIPSCTLTYIWRPISLYAGSTGSIAFSVYGSHLELHATVLSPSSLVSYAYFY